jgi:hypothetical protein
MKNVLFLFLGVVFLTSCSSKFSLQKRKYTKGFYLAHQSSKNHKKITISNKNEKVVALKSAEKENIESIVVEPKKEVQKVVQNNLSLIQPIKQKGIASAKLLLPFTNVFNINKVTKTKIGKAQANNNLEKQRVVKKVIRILLRILASFLLLGAGIAYLLSFADSTFFLIAVLLAAAAVFLIILSILIKVS